MKKNIKALTSGRLNLRQEKGVSYLDMIGLLMVDWDPQEEPDGIHYTISSISEVEGLLQRRCKARPAELWKAYLTPSGGVHAFRVSHDTPVRQGVTIIQALRGDLLYAKMSWSRGYFAVRVSPKMIDGAPREGDFVGRYWKTFGTGRALPENLSIIKVHDEMIERY